MRENYLSLNQMLSHDGIHKRYNIFKFSKREREHDNYGITHTIKHIFVDEDEKNLLMKCYKFECRSCGNNNLKELFLLAINR